MFRSSTMQVTKQEFKTYYQALRSKTSSPKSESSKKAIKLHKSQANSPVQAKNSSESLPGRTWSQSFLGRISRKHSESILSKPKFPQTTEVLRETPQKRLSLMGKLQDWRQRSSSAHQSLHVETSQQFDHCEVDTDGTTLLTKLSKTLSIKSNHKNGFGIIPSSLTSSPTSTLDATSPSSHSSTFQRWKNDSAGSNNTSPTLVSSSFNSEWGRGSSSASNTSLDSLSAETKAASDPEYELNN